MAIKDFPDVSPDANPTFGLDENTTEFNSAISNTSQHMTLPGAKWRGSVSFTNRTRREANKVKAFKTSLGGKAGRFYLTPFDAYQSGTMAGDGVIDGAVASGVSVLPTAGWDADQDTLFEAGDYIEVNGELKMVTDDVSAPQSYIEYTDTNYMPSPFDPENWRPDPDGSITNVTLENPSGSDVAGLAEQLTTGALGLNNNFDNRQSFLSGDVLYNCILYKTIGSWDAGLETSIGSAEGNREFSRWDLVNKTKIAGNSDDFLFTDLGDGWTLLQVKGTLDSDATLCYGSITLSDAVNYPTKPPIGSQLYVQGTYFGKADDYPAQLLATADIPIAPPLRKALSGGETITVDSPKGVFYLGSDSQEWSINVNGVQDMGFDFIEDIN